MHAAPSTLLLTLIPVVLLHTALCAFTKMPQYRLYTLLVIALACIAQSHVHAAVKPIKPARAKGGDRLGALKRPKLLPSMTFDDAWGPKLMSTPDGANNCERISSCFA